MGCKSWIDIATLVILILTLVAVAIYTGITGYQACIARDTARRQLRAYVGVGDPHFGEKFPTQVTVDVENGGQTPAYKLSAYLNRKWLPIGQGLPGGFDYPDLGSHGTDQSSVAYLNPDQKRTFTFPIDHKELPLFIVGVDRLGI